MKVNSKRHANVTQISSFCNEQSSCILPSICHQKKTTPPSENPTVKNKPVQSPTPEKLSELACMISKNENDEPRALVKRALEIWNASGKELSGARQFEETDPISFDLIAENKLLPALRAGIGFVKTGKGVEKAVERYFETIVNFHGRAMAERWITDKQMQVNEQSLEKLREDILQERKLPKRILKLLSEYQINMRKNSHSVSALEIRELLNGADIGLPSSTI